MSPECVEEPGTRPTERPGDMNVKDLVNRVTKMEKKIAELEKKVAELEARPQRVIERHYSSGGYNP